MITGSIVALVTPMNADGSVDWENLDRLVDFHVKEGTDAIVAVGTTGESATLETDEHVAVIERVVKTAAGRRPVIAGTGANNTSEAIELTQEAKRVGADACLLVTPYYNKPPQRGLIKHHEAVAAAVDIPQWLYNVPGRTGIDMLPETIAELAKVPQITAVKEATGDMDRARQLIDLVGDQLAVYSGDDATAYELILLGGKGNISVTANVAPAMMHELCMLALDGKADEARELNERMMHLHNAMFVEANPIPVKWAVERMGLSGSGIRLPLVTLDERLQPKVELALKDAGII
ncbi:MULTISPECIES: 4-hydroxy-tetrahydrodipicolinate synthase [Thalassolituus]|jgi:4-hydroxy-tetrahydrodipicolinate synthase|uniref:4-hydroxy-tetrahydrodipicolinate synthase n=1 Tax=Thalassolituus maritimus TaxID=484498 RepID=A0A1N7N6R7_9GAMM|nr:MULTISPECIES: 4-hydroxy-tetrahydrodipicolinate synthase [Thalassolituus]KZZ11112.1 4-hydroxy-tetrahydrodipicolinate synthase [Oleibacter sp. HI0075]MAX87330.1 4-hydroxy-tetrahydrodipicolinate synthase [Oceanospirillaceae bacterium]MEC8908951.1 4-hydroxy-tetrahydrodipicolinate synthase [Pseudomonadota bacterium]MED5440998.1 4-hydroxy-tetrahydrodipicolinate synthase [Pseudomonadota bacterium]MEE3160571.1 4-hydroxy-tetrahydrodipicolinate synthase [Pseudomonadota bacterium]|tara:strand:+ start:2276 stop:3151 length:876 start_codon:yes stop_codon:yes gene_type:complete